MRANDDMHARADAGIAAFHDGRIADAIAVFAKLVDEHPGEASLRFMLGAYLWEDRRPEEAIPHLRRAVDATPSSEMRSRVLFHALWDAGRSHEAASCLRALLALRKVDDLDELLADLDEHRRPG